MNSCLFNVINKFVFLYWVVTFCINKFNLKLLLKSGKIYENDSLSVLYLLSSNIHTIWFLCVTLYYIFVKYTTTTPPVIFLFLIFTYCLHCQASSLYVNSIFKIPAINTTLQNGLLNIHPVIIYFGYGVILTLWSILYKSDHSHVKLKLSTTILYRVTIIIFIGTYLGALWASQELNWGGFWSWDPVELVSLLLLFYFIKTIHNRSNVIINRPVLYAIITGSIIYFIIRLGVINTIHSFIRSNNNPIYVWICIYFFVVYCSAYLFKRLETNTPYNTITNTTLVGNVTNYLLILVYFCIFWLLCEVLYIWLIIPCNLSQWYFYATFFCVCTYIFLYGIRAFSRIDLFTAPLLMLIIIFYKIHIFVSLFLWFCYKQLNVFIYNYFHICLLLVYFIYLIFFINLSFYSTKTYLLLTNVDMTTTTNSKIVNEFYEISFFLKKQAYWEKLKAFLNHTTGFNISATQLGGLFVFAKNFKLTFLFIIEIVYLCLYVFFSVVIYFIKITYHTYRCTNTSY